MTKLALELTYAAEFQQCQTAVDMVYLGRHWCHSWVRQIQSGSTHEEELISSYRAISSTIISRLSDYALTGSVIVELIDRSAAAYFGAAMAMSSGVLLAFERHAMPRVAVVLENALPTGALAYDLGVARKILLKTTESSKTLSLKKKQAVPSSTKV